MSAIENLLREPAAQAIGWALLHFVWQGALIGVLTAAALVVLRSVVQTVRVTLTREARVLVGADVVVQSQRPLGGDVRARIDATLRAASVAISCGARKAAACSA